MLALIVSYLSVLVGIIGLIFLVSPITTDYRLAAWIMFIVGTLSTVVCFLWFRWPKTQKGLLFVGELEGFGVFTDKTVFKKEKTKIVFGDGSTVTYKVEEVDGYDEVYEEEWVEIENNHPEGPILLFGHDRTEIKSGERNQV